MLSLPSPAWIPDRMTRDSIAANGVCPNADPGELRRLLYLAAMSAIKTKTWRPLYDHYRAKGLSSTATLVILARRIARTAWSIYTHKTEFDPLRLTNPLT